MNILILCTGNSCRSQMAHGFLQSFDKDLIVYSGGTHPSATINEKAVAVMKEAGIDISNNKPDNVELYPNYPNPFNPVTTIKYSLPHSANVKINILDINGKHLENLFEGKLSAGTQYIKFDGSKYASGIYLYRVIIDKKQKTGKMILLR